VEVQAYLNGLAEAASELRRYILDLLRRGRPERSEELLGTMDEVYSLLVTVDFPDAITGGLRRTTDALRAVLERTRSDLTLTSVQTRLLDELRNYRTSDP
jgi:translin